MKQHGLIPGEYAAVHLRALYGDRKYRDPQDTLELAVLGVNCASNLFPGAPIFFASDSSFAMDSALAYGKLHGLPVVAFGDEHNTETNNNNSTTAVQAAEAKAATNISNPIHLDKDPQWRFRTASAYDSTFVDLYMLALSRCVAFSNGGYGAFGSVLSYDSECRMRFFKGSRRLKKCVWMDRNMKPHKLELPNVIELVGGE